MGLILVDSSIWIDLFTNRKTLQTDLLLRLSAAKQRVCVGDLVMTEVLQGSRSNRKFNGYLSLLRTFEQITIVDADVAVEAARNYRHLRSLGITPRKTIDTLIATRCILDDIPLLYSDRDFVPFVEHLGLISAMSLPGAS